MSLPHGFGSRTPPTEAPKRCKLGNRCDGTTYSNKDRCSIHGWIYHHTDAWVAIIIFSAFAIAIGGFLLFVALHNSEVVYPARDMIEGYNCADLAEYIADKNTQYAYAEHRYEWLCVNEQIKEFKG